MAGVLYPAQRRSFSGPFGEARSRPGVTIACGPRDCTPGFALGCGLYCDEQCASCRLAASGAEAADGAAGVAVEYDGDETLMEVKYDDNFTLMVVKYVEQGNLVWNTDFIETMKFVNS